MVSSSLRIILIGVAFASGAIAAENEANRIRVLKHDPVHLACTGLEPGSRYEIETYIGTIGPEIGEEFADIHWGDYPPPAGVLPCPLPDAILMAGFHRNWRTGLELQERGLEINPQFVGKLLWIAYHKIGPTSTEADNSRISLEGEWDIVRDPSDLGKILSWNQPSKFPLEGSKPVQVPGTVNEAFPRYDGIVWYRKKFSNCMLESERLQPILRFKACSYRCEVWLNGQFVGSHEGGESPFEFIVSRKLQREGNTLIVRDFFPKSSFMNGGSGAPCAYPVFWGMGGLIQGVDLVVKPLVRIANVFVRTDWKTGEVKFQTTLVNDSGAPARLKLLADYGEYKSGTPLGSQIDEVTAPPGESIHTLETSIKPFHLWDLDDPFLYRVTMRTQWENTRDAYEVRHFGFRDFRVNPFGNFELNGKRLLLKCIHGIDLDPLSLEGTPRDMTWLGVDFEMLKATGFNAYRSASYAILPEQLDLADELGFLIYSEHQAAWLMKDPAKFAMELPELVRSRRNHPSLVIWGMLNEVGTSWSKAEADAIYHTARNFLPQLRSIDDSRLVFLSSGRFDKDFRTGSASNPESTEWNVYLGGEDPQKPIVKNTLFDGGPYLAGAGDVHIYESHPMSWEFIESMAKIADNVRPIFVSEGGQGSAIDPFGFIRNCNVAGGTSWMADVIEPRAKELEAIWTRYKLAGVFPHAEDLVTASQIAGAAQRGQFLSVIRSNPGINGYSMTDLTDTPDGEGIMDEFRHLKAGHYSVLTEGWAKLRWCMLINPTNAYLGQSLRIRVSLANEDILSKGNYLARISVAGPQGLVWSRDVNVQVQGGVNPPLAYRVFDEDVKIDNLEEAEYTVSARLLDGTEVKAGSAGFHLTDRRKHPDLRGVELTELGIAPSLRELLIHSGAMLHDYASFPPTARELILVGAEFKADGTAWHALHERIARGGFAVFLERGILANDAGANQWIPVNPQGTQTGGPAEVNLWPSQIVACDHPIFRGLPHGLLTPEIYGDLLRSKARFSAMAPPVDVAAVWVNLNNSPGFQVTDSVDAGVTIGTYRYQKGEFLLNSFDLIKNIGHPAADRMILNLVRYAFDHRIERFPL